MVVLHLGPRQPPRKSLKHVISQRMCAISDDERCLSRRHPSQGTTSSKYEGRARPSASIDTLDYHFPTSILGELILSEKGCSSKKKVLAITKTAGNVPRMWRHSFIHDTPHRLKKFLWPDATFHVRFSDVDMPCSCEDDTRYVYLKTRGIGAACQHKLIYLADQVPDAIHKIPLLCPRVPADFRYVRFICDQQNRR